MALPGQALDTFWNQPRPDHSTLSGRALRDRIKTSLGEGLGYWSIFPKVQPDQFSGWILLIPYDGDGPEVEIGWRLNRSAWGNGFAPEAALPILEHAFHTLGLKRIVADIDFGNLPSLRVAEKIGMKHIGDSKHGGSPCKCYVITKADLSEMVSRNS